VISFKRRMMWVGVVLSATVLVTGCDMGSDIPVVQFPEGQKPTPPVPPPPVSGKAKAQMSSMSKGNPGDYSR
jgi:hypothetical protein